MTTNSLRDDLAFMRGIAEGGDVDYRGLAEAYFWAGLIYGGQMLLHAAGLLGLMPSSGPIGLAVGIGPSILFVAVLSLIIARRRASDQGNFVTRSIGAVFASVGLANLALIAAIGSVALREHSVTIWLIYPCVVFVLQGAAWLVAFTLRHQAWHGWVSLGWFATGIAMAVSITYMPGFVLFASLGCFGCMALPGYAMLRHRRSA